ncbi:MAG TPA: ribbon-helix-helix domain-containing protein [Candidatus Agrococcus pullicola]|uniref:Ribbon-helix-helix domain-containing protein n=1 Tax=Candidatus Agrococcus pullicola TaxID=2838429 RepID=A0A9D1YWJ6_9MICO|nr:ribbon-helix-helix domain-containing protein [Candidatus Agrococcus pullicola]
MKRTNIYLDERQTKELDHRAEMEGISRAELVRRLIDAGLREAPGNHRALQSAIDFSFGAIAVDEGTSREEGAREEHLEQLWRLER